MRRLLPLAVLLAGCGRDEPPVKPPVPVRVTPVRLLETSDELRYGATVAPATQVTLIFRSGGYVEEIHRVGGRLVQEGDLVREGTVLARVRQADYEAKVQQAESQRGEAQASGAALQAQVREAEVGLRQARLDFDRARALFDSQSLTKADYDGARSKLDAAAARADAVKQQFAGVEARTRGAAALLQEAELARRDSVLRAPLDGVVLQRQVEIGSLIGPGSPAFVVADTRTVDIVFGVPDTVVGRLKTGMALPVVTEAVPGREFRGTITQIAPAADARSRVFDVKARVANPDRLLKAGMIATVVWREHGKRELPVVPVSAVVSSAVKPGGYAVFIVMQSGNAATARRRDVELGEAFGNSIAVLSGLQLGDRVIVNGASLIRDGERVRVAP